VVGDEVVRMTRLVDDLRVLADTHQPDFLDTEQLDAGALVREVFGKVRRLAPRDWRLEGDGGWVTGDRQRLQQALINLAHNAVQYTAEADRIELGASAADGEVRLWVADSGPGIAAEEHERIFERFTYGAGGLRHPESRGLGLAIVSAIACAHGGRVELDSSPGEGSTFAVVIPVLAHEGEKSDESHPDSGGRAAPVGLPGEGPARQRLHGDGGGRRRHGVAHGA
jgi:two-component system, OmpR family, sensor kinase